MTETNSKWEAKDGLDEVNFCENYLSRHQLCYYDGEFFTPDGRMAGDQQLRLDIYEELKDLHLKSLPARIGTLVEILKLGAAVTDFPPETDKIHFSNGTLYLTDGSFREGREGIVHSRLPVCYRPDAPAPFRWHIFLSKLLHEEDIPTLQEFLGYCLIPSNKGQRMMVIKGNGGEGKTQIGLVMKALLGSCMKDGSIGKISENPFARADLEHVLLMVDDDMRLEALRQTNYVKSIVTSQAKMDLERKGRQSYQGWMFARLLAFSNGDLQALYDRSDGFYRRQLVLETKPRDPDRRDDPFLAEKLTAEAEGILLWALEGLKRLMANNFRFTESPRIQQNREVVRREGNNVYDFLEADDYVQLKADACISSKDLYDLYRCWCDDNALIPMKARSFSDFLIANQKKYNLEHSNNIYNFQGKRVWGFLGITRVSRPDLFP